MCIKVRKSRCRITPQENDHKFLMKLLPSLPLKYDQACYGEKRSQISNEILRFSDLDEILGNKWKWVSGLKFYQNFQISPPPKKCVKMKNWHFAISVEWIGIQPLHWSLVLKYWVERLLGAIFWKVWKCEKIVTCFISSKHCTTSELRIPS